jgi:glycosyltransferase involved in cell wall biosynthesis
MNILYTITSFSPATGGAQSHLHQLTRQLVSRHSLKITSFWDKNRTDWLFGTTLKASEVSRNYQVDNIPVHVLHLDREQKQYILPYALLYYFIMPIAVKKIASQLIGQLKEISSSSQLVHNIRLGREPISYASLQLAHEQHIPFVFTPLHHPRWKGLRYQVFHQLYRDADALIALTTAEKEYLISIGARADNIFVIGTGPVLASSAHPKIFLEDYPQNVPIVLFLGQHYEYKGYLQLLEAAPLVWEKFPETRFVFIGPSVRSSEEHFPNTKDHRIIRLGNVNLQTKTDALAACTLLCVPSTQESFGGVYTEAWSFKKPVIGCPIPAVSEVITNGKDGYLVEQDPAQIAERIIYLIEYPGVASEMGTAGYNKVQARFTWEILAARLEEIYQSIL